MTKREFVQAYIISAVHGGWMELAGEEDEDDGEHSDALVRLAASEYERIERICSELRRK